MCSVLSNLCIDLDGRSQLLLGLVASSKEEDRQILAKGIQQLRYLGRLGALIATQCQSLRQHVGYTHLALYSNSCRV
jgi:hypothetical protein